MIHFFKFTQQILSRNLKGTNPSVTAYTEEDGGVFYDPIPGGLVRTVEDKPQVTVRINNELTACLGDCSYEWLSSSTPVVSSVSPSSGNCKLFSYNYFNRNIQG
jgi:hypothetical protein